MNSRLISIGFIFLLFSFQTAANLFAQDATEIVRRADAKFRGEKSSKSLMTMTIIRPSWSRAIGFTTWTKGTDFSMVLINSPAKEKGQTFLKRKREMWNWNPTISRMIKLPPSMLSQGWMGSDFTNDDLLNQSSIVVDYNHKIVGKEHVSDRECFKIELIPKPNAPVVWGKLFLWISTTDDIQLKAEYFDEDDYLVKTEIGSDIKTFDGRSIPSKLKLIPAEEEGQQTLIEFKDIEFNIPIQESFFSQQNMKRIR